MIALIVSSVIVIVAFVTLFLVHHHKVKEEQRIQLERQVKELDSQAKRYEPLVTKIRPHLLPHGLRVGLAERWIQILHTRQDLGDKNPDFLQHLDEVENLVRDIKAQSNPPVQPIEDKKKGQEVLNQLKSVQFLIMKDYRDGKLSESKGQQFMTDLRNAATQVVIEMNQAHAQEQLKSKKYRAAMIAYNNIIKELKKYKGTDQTRFRDVLKDTKSAMEKIKPLAQQELSSGPNQLAAGMEELEQEEAFQSDLQRAVMASKAKAKSQH
ncbi:hypothetical protein SAMN05660443_1426 [Marinospirillum celere]|uniref:DNA repair protein n=1 Tax=Marinospirillum celere TaxID=1122252 RepID=A0A1I1G6V6_9GAMM|nr:hypothetical protein [Marinospirillum celere]SFC07076.1 hypothetical protein SAMN05660443_1426 [Marinospirillum celere]